MASVPRKIAIFVGRPRFKVEQIQRMENNATWQSKLKSETLIVEGVPMDFILFENFDIHELDDEFIAHFSKLHLRQFSYPRTCLIQDAGVNTIVFEISTNHIENYGVNVAYSNEDGSLYLCCDCQIETKKLCTHQAMALYALWEKVNLHIYFYPEKRRLAYKTTAEKYGLDSTADLDEYFDLAYNRGMVKVIVKNKELLRLDEKGRGRLDALIDAENRQFSEEWLKGKLLPAHRGVVFSEHIYRQELVINLFESELTKDGRPKNPLIELDPSAEIQETQNIEEIKFYAALSFFKGVYHRDQDIEPQLKALKTIIGNPKKFPFYISSNEANTTLSARSITPTKINFAENSQVVLDINHKKDFYEIVPTLLLNDKAYLFQKLNFHYRFFVEVERKLYLLEGENKYKLFQFFKEYNNRLLVPQSQFEEFQQTYLAPLEKNVKINYGFRKNASTKKAGASLQQVDSIKTIYLSESENYILLTPAVRYGKMEVPILSEQELSGIDEIGEWYSIPRDKKGEEKFIGLLLRQHTEFEEQLNGFDHFYLHKKKFYNEGWFINAFADWQDENIAVMGFKELKNNNWNPSKMSVKIGVRSGVDWFDTSIKMKFGQEDVSLQQVQKAVKNKSNYVVLGDGTHGLLPEEWIAKFSAYFRSGDVVEDKIRISKVNYAVIHDLFEEEMIDDQVLSDIKAIKERIVDFKDIKKVAVPKALKGTLRSYQKEGLNWLNFLDEFNFGGCLADDMGLGKTIQIIAFILSLQEKKRGGTHLVVVPTSLLFNWRKELDKFAPTLRLLTNHGQSRAKNTNDFGNYDIILTTYGTLLSDVNKLKKFDFSYIFLDESQAIKNPESMRYKAARLLNARNRIVLTGTPIENNTFDLFAQFSFAVPGIFGSQKRFRDEYSTPIDRFKDIVRARELQEKINPFLLRRTKKQVAKELPEKTEMVLYCEMGEEQRQLYDSQRAEIRDSLLSRDKVEFDSNKSMLLLAGLTKLRQICDSPKILPDDVDFGAESSKMEVLMEEIRTKHKYHKILVFSQFVTMLDLIRAELDKEEISHEYLTGKSKNREEIVHRFQNDDEVRVFLISLKAGGTGLNLTEADYVYIVDPWWNPAVENQAIDRSYRIGQKKNVVAVRLICPDTIEDKIMLLQESKKELAEDLVRTDASVLKSLSKEDLLGLFA